MRRAVLSLVVVATVLALVGYAIPSAQAVRTVDKTPTPSTLDWTACPGEDNPPGMECATVPVPVAWDNPSGRTITLNVARLRGTDSASRIGSVLYVPGGPGGAGIPRLKTGAEKFTALRTRFDIVTWDPRGALDVWLSEQASDDCLWSGPTFAYPTGRAEFDALADRNRAITDRCRRHDPELFDTMDSATQARDMDVIRQALGEPELNFLAQSYGGVFGISYARSFPERVRTMFFDGAVEHMMSIADDDRIMYQAAEAHFTRFQDWCRSTPTCPLAGQDIPVQWRHLVATADWTPIPVKGSQPPISYTGLDLETMAQPFLVNGRFAELATAIRQAQQGDAAGMALPARGGHAFFTNAGLSTQCDDGDVYTGFRDYLASVERGHRLSPNFPRARTAWRTKCLGWPTPVANPRRPLDPTGLPPLLGAGTWTDFHGPAAIADAVPGSVAIKIEGYGHGLYMNHGNPCVIAHANQYFIDQSLPPTGTVCPPSSV